MAEKIIAHNSPVTLDGKSNGHKITCTGNVKNHNTYPLKIIVHLLVIELTETDLQRKHTRISEIREVVGIFEIDVEELKNSPLKIKVKQVLNASGDCYIGVANLTIKGKGCRDFYRSMHPQKTKEEALDDAVDGFFAYLSDESEIKEVKNW